VTTGSAARSRAIEQARAELAQRLETRRTELEEAIAARVYAIADPREVADPTYLEGLRASLTAALDYALTALGLGERRAPPVPPVLLVQARMAAQNRVGLDTVMRRYLAGYSLLSEYVIQEAEESMLLTQVSLHRLLKGQAALFDRLLAAISDEHSRAVRSRPMNSEERRRACVERLLAGELVDSSELTYRLDGHHLGLMATGDRAQELMPTLALNLDRRLLAVQIEKEPVWACWLGGRHPLEAERAVRALADMCPQGVAVTVGESGEGLAGWRLSHRQAKAALPIAERGHEPVVRYTDVALLTSMLQDDLLITSLHQCYLQPLDVDGDNGQGLCRTLQAYFACDRNSASTAAALGVTRQTVNNRLRVVEERFGRPLPSCAAELEAALRLAGAGCFT